MKKKVVVVERADEFFFLEGMNIIIDFGTVLTVAFSDIFRWTSDDRLQSAKKSNKEIKTTAESSSTNDAQKPLATVA